MQGSDRPRWLSRSLVELLVIIAGVMIALAADRWIAGIDERAEARSYMSRLTDNLRADSTNLEISVRQAADRRQTALDMLLYAQTGEFPSGIAPDSLLRMLVLTGAPSGAPYSTETWRDMVSTGNVELISDVELRDSLSVYYNEVERARGLFGGDFFGGGIEVRNGLWEVQSPLQMLAAVRGDSGRAVFLPAELDGEYRVTADQAVPMLRTLRTRKDFLAGIGRLRQLHSVSLTVHKGQLERATWLLEQIEGEGE